MVETTKSVIVNVELHFLLTENNMESVNYNNLNYIERKNIREEYIKIQK